jgi:hypothetical protein
MMETQLLKKDLKTVGEEISHELAYQMINDFQIANPVDIKGYYIGRNIIDQILEQPNCVGMRLYHGYNEEGKKTLVYVGVNELGENISEYTVICPDGTLEVQKGIFADRDLSWLDWLKGGR